MKRAVCKLLVFLLLGAAVNVAVAWGIMLAHGSMQDVRDAVYKVMFKNERALTASEEQWYRANQQDISPMWGVVPAPWMRGTPTAADEPGIGWRQTVFIEYFHGPGGGKTKIRVGNRDVMGTNGGLTTVTTAHCVACGWPVQSMTIVLGPPALQPGWRMPSLRGVFPAPAEYVLPVHTVLPQFLIDTIFYASICWLLFAAPFAIRRHRRIERGLCPTCAYPTGTSPVCTECGASVKPKAVEAAA